MVSFILTIYYWVTKRSAASGDTMNVQKQYIVSIYEER